MNEPLHGQPAPIKPEEIRTRSRRQPTTGETATGAIICSQDLKGLRLLDAALNLWSARQKTMGFALLLFSAVSLSSAQTVETSPALPDQPSAEVQPVANSVMDADAFFTAYPDADASDYDDYLADAEAFEQGEREGFDNATRELMDYCGDSPEENAETIRAYLGGDVDNGSAKENKQP